MSAITPTILSDGREMDPSFSLLSIDVTKEVNRVPDAELTLLDGNVARQAFPVGDSAFFEPGKDIEIRLRYEGQADTTLMKGKVVRQTIQAGAEGSISTVSIKDPAVKLTHPRHSAVFRDVSDGDVIGRLIEDAGLTKGNVAPTEPRHAELVQYDVSNWDFMLARADVLGLLVLVDDGAVTVSKIDLSGSPRHRFEFGISDIFDFEFELDTINQSPGMDAVAWDLDQQQTTQPSAAENFALSQGNLDPASLAERIGFEPPTLSHQVPLASEELQSWANARMRRSRMAMIRGRMSVRGDASIKPMDIIELAGIGDRFGGTTLVTGVRHRVDDQGWRTDLQVGLSPDWFSQKPDIQIAPAAGLLPAASGLQIGVIDAFEEDPDEQWRVRVALPAIGADDAFVWARLASPDAGDGRGVFFRPEPGDEVVVGFFNNDPRQAVVLGSMHSSAMAAPEDFATLSEDNIDKGIVTKSGTKIRFVDAEKAALHIETAQGNKILLDDDAESIQIVDQHDNIMTMDSNGVSITSNGDFKVEASGNVEIAGSQVEIK